MKTKPIKSQDEYDKSFDYVVTTAMEKLNIDRIQAEKRVIALLKSGILETGAPDNKVTQFLMDEFMKKEQP